MLAPSIPQVLKDLSPDGKYRSIGPFCVTVYILGFCVGPLLFAPLTDFYGRTRISRACSAAYLLATFGCALAPSIPALIVLRFCAGCFGGAPMAIGGAIVADLYAPGDRSGPLAFYGLGTMLAPTLGPVIGGVITGNLGWRWVFWIAAIMVGSLIVCLLERFCCVEYLLLTDFHCFSRLRLCSWHKCLFSRRLTSLRSSEGALETVKMESQLPMDLRRLHQ
jgi:multidrug resistance protein